MKNKLQQYFPMIRSREEVMEEINTKENLREKFYGWQEEQRKEFLDFCTGVRGVKVLYDFFAKELLNPETAPERLNELLSLLLKQNIRILKVLPNDSTRIADEGSLVITDIVVELEDGSLANIEIQKIGYNFPGQRSACYSSDLLLRQYKRVKSRKKKKFSYKDIKSVYTIVLFEKSTWEFHQYPEIYLHYFEQKSDSGLEVELLQKYLFVPLDIFRAKQRNNDIKNKLDAWLAFLCMDDPEMVLKIIDKYPEFKSLYEQAYDICRNVEKVMGMFSKELYELDRNTVQYMIDEMQEEINERKRAMDELLRKLTEKQEELAKRDEEIARKKEEIAREKEKIEEKDKQIEENKQQIEEKKKQIEEKEQQIEEKKKQVEEKEQQIEEKKKQIEEKDEEIKEKTIQLKEINEAYQQIMRKISELENESNHK